METATNTPTVTPAETKRSAFIAARTAELQAKGYTAKNAARRAAKDWRLQSPAHKRAIARCVALADARLEVTGDPSAYKI